MSPIHTYLLAGTSIAIGAVGQFLLKLGANRLGAPLPFFRMVWAVLATPTILAGILCFGLSMLLWVLVLRVLPLSTAYPMVSLSYVIVTALSALFLGETLTAAKLLGLALIMAGVVLVGSKIA